MYKRGARTRNNQAIRHLAQKRQEMVDRQEEQLAAYGIANKLDCCEKFTEAELLDIAKSLEDACASYVSEGAGCIDTAPAGLTLAEENLLDAAEAKLPKY